MPLEKRSRRTVCFPQNHSSHWLSASIRRNSCWILFALGFKLKITGGIVICLLILFTIEGSFAYALSTAAVDCGCFSTEGGGESIGVKFFFRNGLLILFSLLVTEGQSQPSSDSNKPFGWSSQDGGASQNFP